MCKTKRFQMFNVSKLKLCEAYRISFYKLHSNGIDTEHKQFACNVDNWISERPFHITTYWYEKRYEYMHSLLFVVLFRAAL